MPSYSPMMEQYFDIKRQYPYCLLFFRLGDFYEMFFEDAIIASKELEIALTSRDCGQEERAPMCGVPHHSANGYIARLVEKGYHVAICEQMEDSKSVKGIVKREVVRVITPGTITESTLLDEGRNNYLVCLYQTEKAIAYAAADITTGAFMATSLASEEDTAIMDELTRLNPAEILVNESFTQGALIESVFGLKPTVVPVWTFNPRNAFKCLTEHFKVLHMEGFGFKENTPEISAAGALLAYLAETQKNALSQITGIKYEKRQTHMTLDSSSRRNLELTAAMRDKTKRHSLLWVLDKTETAMGARLLRTWVERPLLSTAEIHRRMDAVAELKDNTLLREELKELLHTVHDLERLITRIASVNANGRDLTALKTSLTYLPQIGRLMAALKSDLNAEIYRTFDDLSDIRARIDACLVEEPPVGVKEGGMIRVGVDAELDRLIEVKQNGGNWLSELEARERDLTGVKNLRIKYNKIFGYNIELTNSQKHLAPDRYIRRQTLANCERYVTEELKTLEETLLGADEKQAALEFTLFDTLRREIVEQIARIQFTAFELATLDALQSLAAVAEHNRYCRPVVNENAGIYIREGRHPVIELMTPHAFIPNDTKMDGKNNRLSIITGPNMAGKSTYMRQVALIVLMAQIGSFVPAAEAEIGVVDRIFTRVGASDDLATGQSTFMVEMTEVANILHNASAKSLILLDEIGRGTSTFDGLSIAWAVLEYIADVSRIGAKTLFATHYHELTELEGKVPGVVNFFFSVREMGEDIVFLRKLARGGADHSYGIPVARLAGLPAVVLDRARELLSALNKADIVQNADSLPVVAQETIQSSVAQETIQSSVAPIPNKSVHVLISTLKALNIDKITPLEALTVLAELKEKYGGETA